MLPSLSCAASVVPLGELDAVLDPIHDRMQMPIEMLSGPMAADQQA
jgi:hypothetical protein